MADLGMSPTQDPAAGPPVNPSQPVQATSPPRRPPVPDEPGILFGPNLIATAVSFFFLLIAPTVVSYVLYELLDPGEGQVGPFLLPMTLIEGVVVAFGGAVLLLVIGLILQFWQHLRPFSSWWPIILVLPIVWALVLPEVLVRGGSLLSWLIFGTALAGAFAVHWVALVAAREAID
jgi:hypothetical protein